jgi:hypothetical protein
MPPAFNLSQDQTLQFNHADFMSLDIATFVATQEFIETCSKEQIRTLLECLIAFAIKHPRLSAVNF